MSTTETPPQSSVLARLALVLTFIILLAQLGLLFFILALHGGAFSNLESISKREAENFYLWGCAIAPALCYLLIWTLYFIFKGKPPKGDRGTVEYMYMIWFASVFISWIPVLVSPWNNSFGWP